MNTQSVMIGFGMLLGVASILSGCTSQTGEGATTEETTVTLAFTLSIDPSVQTRDDNGNETWNSEYESEETSYDQSIDLENVQVSLWDTNGHFLVEINALNCTYSDSNTYQYYGTLKSDLLTSGQKYRCMVLANGNTADYEGLSTKFTTASLPDDQTSQPYQLPMWGMTTFTVIYGTAHQNVGIIPLLRSAAKCRLHLSQELIDAGYTLSDGKLQGYNQEGYLFPQHATEVSATGDLSFVADNTLYGFRPLSEWNGTESRVLLHEPGKEVSGSATETTSLIGYFPEITQTDECQQQLLFTLHLPNGGQVDFTTLFKDYASTQQALISDLQRNHVYDFEIISVKYGLEINATVSDWEGMSEVWDFTETISGDLNIKWESGTYASASAIDTETSETEEITNTLTLMSGVTAVGNFTISTPSGATWYASLTGDTGNYFTFEKVTDQGTEQVSTLSGETGTQATIRIRSTLSGNTQEHSAKLTVLIRRKDGTSSVVKELSGWEIIQPI